MVLGGLWTWSGAGRDQRGFLGRHYGCAVLVCQQRQSNVTLQGLTRMSPGLRKGSPTGTGRSESRDEVRAPEVLFLPVLQALLAPCVNAPGAVMMLCVVPGDLTACCYTQTVDCSVQGQEAILPLSSADALGEYRFDFC